MSQQVLIGFSSLNGAAYHGTWYGVLRDVVTGSFQALVFLWLYVLENWQYVVLRPLGRRIWGSRYGREKARQEGYPQADNKTLKVVNVGYGRTGTVSMLTALTELGYHPYHSIFVSLLIDELEAFHQDLVAPSMQSGKAELQTMDLKFLVHQGYDALLDQPFSYYYEQIMQEYPDCKFILTTREPVEAWYQSYHRMTSEATTLIALGGWFLPTFSLLDEYERWNRAIVTKDDSYMFPSQSPPLSYVDPEATMASYQAHNARVRAMIPPEKLLEFRVSDGWEPLCRFLEVDQCPSTTPFPRSNSKLFQGAFFTTIAVVILAVGMLVAWLGTMFLVAPLIRAMRGPNQRLAKAKGE